MAQNFAPPKGSYYNYATSCGLVGTPYQYCAQPVSNLDAWGLSNTLDWDFGHGFDLKSISAERYMYQRSASDQDGSPLSWLMNTFNMDYKQYSQELRLSGPIGEKIRWTVGGYFFQYNATQGARVSLDGATNELATFDFLENDLVHNDSRSGFAHLEYTPIDKLTLTAGVRYTKDHKSFIYGRSLAPGYPGTFLDQSVLPINGVPGVFRGNRTDYNFTADYKFTPDVSVYFTTGTGYKGGGINPRPYYATQALAFNPETVTSYEVGVKTFLFDHRIRMNISAYNNLYHQIQLTLNQCPQYVPVGLPEECALPANVGDATVRGFEFESEMHLFGGATIDMSADYIHFRYTSIDRPRGSMSATRRPSSLISRRPSALNINWSWVTASVRSRRRLDFTYVARQQEQAANIAQSWNPGYGLLNGRITWTNPAGDTNISLEGSNLLNKYYAITSSYNYPPVSSSNYSAIDPGPPRMVAVSIRRKF